MAVYISEYMEVGIVVQEPALVEQTVSVGGASVQSAPFGAATDIVRIHASAACHIRFGADPTASTSVKRMGADQTEYFAVTPGHKVAVIASS